MIDDRAAPDARFVTQRAAHVDEREISDLQVYRPRRAASDNAATPELRARAIQLHRRVHERWPLEARPLACQLFGQREPDRGSADPERQRVDLRGMLLEPGKVAEQAVSAVSSAEELEIGEHESAEAVRRASASELLNQPSRIAGLAPRTYHHDSDRIFHALDPAARWGEPRASLPRLGGAFKGL